MELSEGIGVRFSELKDNHEPAPYWVWNRRDVRTYTRFGVLPGGESFGVAHTPTQENSYARDTVIVSEDGEIRACGWNYPDGVIVPLSQLAESHSGGIRGYMESCLYAFSEVDGFLIGGDVVADAWELCSIPVRELRFAPRGGVHRRGRIRHVERA